MKKKIVIITLSLLVLIMVIGYAAFSTNLKINGTANIASTWNILFTKIEEVSKTSGVTVTTPPQISGTFASFNVDFKLPGDKIIYNITVSNQGTLDAIVNEITASETGSDGIYFNITGIKKGDTLNKKTSKIITVEIGYLATVTSQPGDLRNDLSLGVTYTQNLGQSINGEDLTITGPTLTTVSGSNNLSLKDSVGRVLNNYLIYGNSIQNGTPSPDKPVSIESFGEDGINIDSSSGNLVTNGYGELGNNTNFGLFNYSTDTPSSDIKGSFTKSTNAVDVFSGSEYIAVDPTKTYNYSVYLKNLGNADTTYYIGFTEYDIDKKMIDTINFMYIPNTLTTLKQDLNDGDKIVYLDDVSSFVVNADTPYYQRGLIFWNYKDSTGYLYPPLTYSRNTWRDLYTYDKVDKVNNTITLKEEWNHGTIPKGTLLSQNNDGQTYNYCIRASQTIPSTWTKYSAVISGIYSEGNSGSSKFRPGTKYIRILVWFGGHTTNASMAMAGIDFRESNTANIETGEPLRKVGSSSDYIDFANKRVVRKIGVYSFNGKENWTCSSSTSGKSLNCFINQTELSNLTGGKINKTNTALLSTHFPYTNLGNSNYKDRDGNGIYGYSDSSAAFIITTNKVKNVSEWKSYLEEQASKKTPVTIYYELNSSINEPIILPNVKTRTGDSNIVIESNIASSGVSLSYYKKS